MDELTQALVATGATLAFDAIGGGKLAGQILGCMEAALNTTAKEYSRYGSTTHKQVYLYGGLDTSPTELERNFGMAWGMGGWLLSPFLQRIGAARRAGAEGACRRRTEDDVREPLHAHRLARRRAAGRRDRGVRPARDRVESADRSERVTSARADAHPPEGVRPRDRPGR